MLDQLSCQFTRHLHFIIFGKENLKNSKIINVIYVSLHNDCNMSVNNRKNNNMLDQLSCQFTRHLHFIIFGKENLKNSKIINVIYVSLHNDCNAFTIIHVSKLSNSQNLKC
jgi:hypothetical protein